MNFETHQSNIVPCFFDFTSRFSSCHLEINNGSFYYNNFHIHHWIIGILILGMLLFFNESCIKSSLQGLASAMLIDGLLFEDRFRF